MEAAGVEPLIPYPGNSKPWLSVCGQCQRQVSPTLANVRNGTKACKYCAGRAIPETDAIEVMVQAGANPLIPFPGAKVPWLCECSVCGRRIQPTYRVAKVSGVACNFCKNKRIDAVQAESVMLAAQLMPLEPYSSVHTKWRCECLKCGRETFPTFQKVRLRGHQCGWCARTRISPSDAEKILVSANVSPIGAYPGSQKPWPSICNECGRKVTPKVSVVAYGGGACKYCAGKKVDAGEAEGLMVGHGVKPLVPFPGSNKQWESQCLTCLRIVSPAYSNVKQGHAPCVYCAAKKVDPKTAFDFALSRKLEPLEPFPGAVKPWKLRCKKCDEVTFTTWTIIGNKRKDAGCANCTPYGFKPNEPSFFYLIEHEKFDAYKLGISNLGSGRLAKHNKNGWLIRRLLKFEKGSEAYSVEQLTLAWVRNDLLIPPAFFEGDGWTETMPMSRIGLDDLFIKSLEIAGAKGVSFDVESLNKSD